MVGSQLKYIVLRARKGNRSIDATAIDHATLHRAERQGGEEQRGNDIPHGEFFLNRIVAGSHHRLSQTKISVR
jgi:hypothetical protein